MRRHARAASGVRRRRGEVLVMANLTRTERLVLTALVAAASVVVASTGDPTVREIAGGIIVLGAAFGIVPPHKE